jgi:phage tail-like protein
MTQDAVPSFRFYLEVANVLEAVFTEVSGLQTEMETVGIEEGGINGFTRRVPGRVKVSNLTLKRGMTRSNDFIKWFMSTRPGSVDRRNISLVLYDVKGEKIASWHFQNAYPVKWVGPQFTSDGNAVAVETVELAHEGMTVE